MHSRPNYPSTTVTGVGYNIQPKSDNKKHCGLILKYQTPQRHSYLQITDTCQGIFKGMYVYSRFMVHPESLAIHAKLFQAT